MALKQVIETLEGVPEALHPEYTKADDGKYHLNVEGLPEMSAALKAANKEAADRRKSLEKYKDVDPEEYQRLKTLEEEITTKKAQAEGDFSKIKEQMVAKHQADLERETKKSESYRTALERHLVDAQATAAIAAAKGVPQLLLPHVKDRVKVIEENGQFTVQVLDEKGNPMVMDAAGTPATIGYLVESLKANPVYGLAFEGRGASGSGGHQGGGTTPKTMTLAAFNALSTSERLAFQKSGGALT